MNAPEETRRGTIQGFCAYLIWGTFPLYFHALLPAGAWEILAHRILWTMLLCVAVLLVTGRLRRVLNFLRDPRRAAMVSVAAFTIAINWVLYVLAVISGHTTEAALGYFLNPLVTVALGVLVLRESLRPGQWVAVGIGALACIYLAIDYGRPPWISVALALSFATYGLMKNRIGGSMTALESLSAETLVLTPVAFVVLGLVIGSGASTFASAGAGHTLLLILSGAATAAPLLLFASAARRIPLVTIGLLQFVTPILQLLCGVLVLGEHMPLSRWIGFGIVWLALVVLTIDSVTASARSRRLARAASGAAC
ncbi:EamA family transporter RarD [Dermacoccaceae bacterium W4C1]